MANPGSFPTAIHMSHQWHQEGHQAIIFPVFQKESHFNVTFTLGVFYDLHAGCRQGVDAGQYKVDAGLSDVYALHASTTDCQTYAAHMQPACMASTPDSPASTGVGMLHASMHAACMSIVKYA